MVFREPLPASCPPASPNFPKQVTLWRMLKGPTVTDADFDSQIKKNPHRQYPDLCGARGISLVTSFETCIAVSKSPRAPKFTHAVEIKVCSTVGVWNQDKPSHVNWWVYQGAIPTNQVLGPAKALPK